MTAQETIRIGSRGSTLALWQSNFIKGQLEAFHPGLEVEIQIIKTKGDIIQDVALSKIGDKGLFTKELEVALSAGEVDLCVHSMKDVPTVLPQGLVLGPIPKRARACDALVARPGIETLEDLPAGAKIGTGSLRRRAQLYAMDRGFELVQLRGNLDTRIRRVEEGDLDAAILAAAGIERLGWHDRITAYIPEDVMTPAVGQGSLALELREGDTRTLQLLSALADAGTTCCVGAERYVMKALEGGCQVPIGAYGCIAGDARPAATATDTPPCGSTVAGGQPAAGQRLSLDAMVGMVDGSTIIRAHAEGDKQDWEAVAAEVVESLLEQGAEGILEAARSGAGDDGSVVPLYG